MRSNSEGRYGYFWKEETDSEGCWCCGPLFHREFLIHKTEHSRSGPLRLCFECQRHEMWKMSKIPAFTGIMERVTFLLLVVTWQTWLSPFFSWVINFSLPESFSSGKKRARLYPFFNFFNRISEKQTNKNLFRNIGSWR